MKLAGALEMAGGYQVLKVYKLRGALWAQKSEVLAAACAIFITQIALVRAMLGLGPLLSLRE
jgi:hypothetical protein